MKMNNFFKILVLSAFLGLATNALAQQNSRKAKPRVNVAQDVDQLGGNQDLIDKAQAIDPNNRARVVQSRIVDRNFRLELGVNGGAVLTGDTYFQTRSLGAQADFHINPRWSIGARYYDHGNELTPEGQRVYDEATKARQQGGKVYTVPDLDFPQRTALAVVNWYPIYGKTNLLDWGIAQFDMYLLAGAGQIELTSGWTNAYTAGAGVGFWITHRITARAELRTQFYKDNPTFTGERDVQATNGSLGFGFML